MAFAEAGEERGGERGDACGGGIGGAVVDEGEAVEEGDVGRVDVDAGACEGR